MKRITIIMMLLSVFSKLFGFVREIVLSNTYGAGVITDGFIYAYNLPGTLFSVIVAAFVTGFIPMFTRIEKEDGKEESIKFANNVQNVMLLIAIVVSVLVFVFTEQFLALLVPHASEAALVYLLPFVKVAIFTLIFTCIIQIMTGFLQIRQAFIVPLLLAFPMNLILISFILISKTIGANILPYGILLAYATQAILILWFAYRKGFKLKFYINFKDKHLQTMLILAVPLIIGSATSSIGGLVNQALASGIEGGISHIGYATKIGGLIEGVFGLAIVSVMYPTLASAVANNDHQKASHEYQNAMSSLLLFIVPCMVGMTLLAQPIVEFVYMRGEFGADEAAVLTNVFRTYSLGLVSYSLYGLIAKVFYSFQNTRTPMIISVGNITLQIILGQVLSRLIGLQGITLSMAISATVGVIAIFIASIKLFDNLDVRALIKEISKIVISALVMGVAVLVIYTGASTVVSATVSLLGAIAAAIVVYFASIYILKVNVVTELIANFKRSRG